MQSKSDSHARTLSIPDISRISQILGSVLSLEQLYVQWPLPADRHQWQQWNQKAKKKEKENGNRIGRTTFLLAVWQSERVTFKLGKVAAGRYFLIYFTTHYATSAQCLLNNSVAASKALKWELQQSLALNN